MTASLLLFAIVAMLSNSKKFFSRHSNNKTSIDLIGINIFYRYRCRIILNTFVMLILFLCLLVKRNRGVDKVKQFIIFDWPQKTMKPIEKISNIEVLFSPNTNKIYWNLVEEKCFYRCPRAVYELTWNNLLLL